MQNQLKEKPWTSVSTSLTGLSQKYHVITCPVKMKGNEMGNEREPTGSTIMHKSSIVLTLLLSKLVLQPPYCVSSLGNDDLGMEQSLIIRIKHTSASTELIQNK